MPINSFAINSTSASSKRAVHRINAISSVQALVIDEDVIFGGLQGGFIVAWSLETFECLGGDTCTRRERFGIEFIRRSKLLFSAGADSVVNIWSTQSLDCLHSIRSYHEVGDIFCTAYSNTLQTLFSGSQNGSIQWYMLTSEPKPSSPTSESPSRSRKDRFFDALRPDDLISSINDQDSNGHNAYVNRHVQLMDRDSYTPYAHKSYIHSIMLTRGLFEQDPEEEMLISGDGGGTIKLWKIDVLSKRGLISLYKFKNPGLGVLSLACKGFFLYAGLSNGIANIYNLESKQPIRRLQVGHGDVSQIQIFKDSVLCGTSEGWVKRFNTHFLELENWRSHNGKILATALISNFGHDILATGGNDNTVSIWDISDDSTIPVAAAAHSNDDLINALRDLVAYRTIPGVARCINDCHQAVNFLRKRCNTFGATTTLFSPDDGVNPILLAKFPASKNSKSTKTVLFYGHYDVVEAETQTTLSNDTWHADPFTLHPLNGYLYGRGVTDNKGPILAALYAVADLAQQNALSCNVTFLLEGDEEAGSRGFRTTVQAHHDKIGNVDYILLSNSYWLDDHIPCLTFGMRGVVHATVIVDSNKPDLHSGMDGKSIQHEPLKDLTALVGKLIGEDGLQVMIPGFNDAVDELGRTEREEYRVITSTLLHGHKEIKDETSFARSLMQRWRYPNLTVHRIEVPEAKKAATIARSATATLSIRIVPSQTAEEVANGLTTFLKGQFMKLQSPNKFKVEITSKADPWLGDTQSAIYEALSSAVTEVWMPDTALSSHRAFPISEGEFRSIPEIVQRQTKRRASTLNNHGSFTVGNLPREPLFIREGGSIPALSFLEKVFNAPAAMFPMGQASDSAHLDNERIRVKNLYNGREVLKKVFSRL